MFYQSEIARLQWEQAKQTADPGSLTVAYRRIAQAQAQLDQVSLPPTQLQIDRADLAVAQAELALDQARLQLARTELRAPFDGVVAAVNARAGEAIGLSQPAVVLIDVDRFRLDLTVNEVDVAQLAEGQAVAVTVDAVPDEVITGRVERIAPTSLVVGGAVNYLVRVVLDPSQAALRAGMSATAEVTVATVEQVLLAPNWAIRRDRRTGQAFVSLKEGEALREAPIVTGLRGDDYTEVKSGVSVGDVAAVSTVRDNPFETGN